VVSDFGLSWTESSPPLGIIVDEATQILQEVSRNLLRILDTLHEVLTKVSRPDFAVDVMGGLLHPQGERVGRSQIETDAAFHKLSRCIDDSPGVVGYVVSRMTTSNRS
jgi:hypothetical protein